MNSSRFLSSQFCFSLLLVFLRVSKSSPLSEFTTNSDVQRTCRDNQYRCGNLTAGFPFWGGERIQACGHLLLKLECDKNTTTTGIQIEGQGYNVLQIDSEAQVMKIASKNYMDGLCPSVLRNTSINGSSLFDYVTGYKELIIHYNCTYRSNYILPLRPFNCPNIEGFNYYIEGDYDAYTRCTDNVSVVVADEFDSAMEVDNLMKALKEGFEVKLKVDGEACRKCVESSGTCGFAFQSQGCYCGYPSESDSRTCSSPLGPASSQFISPEPSPGRWDANDCADDTSSTKCHPIGSSANRNWVKKVAIGVSAAVTGIMVISVVVIYRLRRKLFLIWKKDKKSDKDVEEFIKANLYLVPKRYNFSDIKKMTNSFRDTVGKGAFGTVYRGKLSDGSIVAVKVLSESKGNGEDFINEVASMSRTSHVNIVTFVGFCYEKRNRALIYEFVPNGSLDNFIYDKRSFRNTPNLGMETLYSIAVGIARGLEYLHRGCNTKIVHFDIKPHNILLDEDFCPKISDFGLAKLCLKKESVISMLGARGTAGYIAPEVFCRNFGGVSHKSDVYSYGMMILEMVGGRKNIDPSVSQTSEIYFPYWIYNQLEPGKNLRLDGDITEEEGQTAKKMIIVGLWCIQTNPSDRPSMTKVVEMLEGTLESLNIPPNPSLSSTKESA